jgi:hypothetical protein
MVSSNVNVLLYLYLFVCILLIAFNVFYIFYADLIKSGISREAGNWVTLIRNEVANVETKGVSEKHLKKIKKDCIHTNGLLAYYRALESLKTEEDLLYNLALYMKGCKQIYTELAFKYINKEDMDKAFMAYFLADTYFAFENDYQRIYIILKEYVVDSSIYCRENILKALYALGDAEKLYDFILLIDRNEMYHHKKLLTDGLCSFNGDKERLAELLWSHRDKVSENTLLSIIGFITVISDGYKEEFYKYIQKKTIPLEVRLACIRYFRKHTYDKVIPLLYSYMDENIDTNISIVTASVLSAYPSEETKDVLKQALTSRNWYIRLNAANSLVDIGLDEIALKDVLAINDRYAKEVLIYVLEERGIDVPVCGDIT